MKKVLFTATLDVFILQFQIPILKLFKDYGYKVYVITNSKDKLPYCDVKYFVPFDRNPLSLNNIRMEIRETINQSTFRVKVNLLIKTVNIASRTKSIPFIIVKGEQNIAINAPAKYILLCFV